MTQDMTPQLGKTNIFETPRELGEAAAHDVAAEIRRRLASQPSVRLILAAAPSQAEMLHALAKQDDIDWQRVEAFHMDEYIGLSLEASQRFGNWLTREFFRRVPLGKVNLIEPGGDPHAAAQTYQRKLSERPIDIVCLGIGMNGHLAFNDPPADFHERQDVRVVALDLASRMQQVKEGLFPALADVPEQAISLSIPALLRADKLFCCASGQIKRDAVTRAFTGEVSPDLPASILREHPACTVYLDTNAAAGLPSGDR